MDKFIFWPAIKDAVFIPITCPLELTSAPPLLPEDIGAVCWIVPSSSILLIIPSLTLFLIPSGLPIANTLSPELYFFEIFSGLISFWFFNFNIAMSSSWL